MRRRPHVEDHAVESIDIGAPPAKVWELLTRLEGIPTWYDGWDAVERTSTSGERLTVGLPFQLLGRRSGRRTRATCRVTELDPLRRICWVEAPDDGAPEMVRFDLLEIDVGRTRVQFTRAAVAHGVGAAIERLPG